MVIKDGGISTRANLAWLVAYSYRYLAVRIGRLKPKLGMGVSQHFTVNLVANESGKTATALT